MIGGEQVIFLMRRKKNVMKIFASKDRKILHDISIKFASLPSKKIYFTRSFYSNTIYNLFPLSFDHETLLQPNIIFNH